MITTFLNFVASAGGGHCDYSPWVPKKPGYATVHSDSTRTI